MTHIPADGLAPLILSTWAQNGGAALAAYRLVSALRALGVPARMLATDSAPQDPALLLAARPRAWRTRALRSAGLALERSLHPTDRIDPWSNGCAARVQASELAALGPAPLHLHWISQDLVTPETLARFQGPLVWTLHDQWPFTGGCHYSGACERFTQGCGSCPLHSAEPWRDLSRINLARKKRIGRDRRQIVVSPSQWLTERAQRSIVFAGAQFATIPNPVDLTLFAPNASRRQLGRERWGMPDACPIILFGAHNSTDPRKGFDLLAAGVRAHLATLQRLGARIAVMGERATEVEALGLPTHRLGTLSGDRETSLAYLACDLFVAPSREDNFPNTLVEAGACGLPCVGFSVGGIPEILADGQTGRLIPPFDTQQLGLALVELCEQPELGHRLGQALSAQVRRRCEPGSVAGAYRDVYQAVLAP